MHTSEHSVNTMSTDSEFRVAVMPGDGIGPEVCDVCLKVLHALVTRVAGLQLMTEVLAGGAAHYRDTGVALPDESTKAAEDSDAILFGAMGLPDVRMPDGTEINPQVTLRIGLELYAGVRPIKAMPGMPLPLADPRARDIDLVIIREQTEGLFADFQDKGTRDGDTAVDRCVVTRAGTSRVVDFAFRLADFRRSKGRPGHVTCVDKANVLTSMAFFREIFDERRGNFPTVDAGHAYIDATALNLVRQPRTFDVLVTENLLGDILSDLAAGLIGGMGVAPSADIGDRHAMFPPCHGSAPDIAGIDKANPIALLLSAAMMLDWLGERHHVSACLTAATRLRQAIERGFANGLIRPYDFGGTHGTRKIAQTVIDNINTR
ncbi:MAG: isocitrate/isopropylmalate dehydrogenase family protein [Gammaproteobacteria bacterium]|nr:isocitrate/isopropylmalate dehydrogenase family protein [Gammaproteobacteria bacterium]